VSNECRCERRQDKEKCRDVAKEEKRKTVGERWQRTNEKEGEKRGHWGRSDGSTKRVHRA